MPPRSTLPKNTARARLCSSGSPLLLSALDTFPLYGRRHFLFLRRTVFRCRKKPPIRVPPDVATHHARARPSPSQAIWKRSSWLRSRRVGTRARKCCACRLLRQVRPKSSHAIHLLDTGDRLLAEASPYDLLRGIGYRADHVSARQPLLWCGLNLLGKALQTVRCLFRDRAPPPTRHQPLSPQGDSLSSRDCIFEVDPSTRQ